MKVLLTKRSIAVLLKELSFFLFFVNRMHPRGWSQSGGYSGGFLRRSINGSHDLQAYTGEIRYFTVDDNLWEGIEDD